MSITLVLLSLLAVGFVGYLLYPKLQARLAEQASPVQTVGNFQRGLSALGGQSGEMPLPPGARPVLRPPSVHDAPLEAPSRPGTRPATQPIAVPPAPSTDAARRRQNVGMTLGMMTVFFALAGIFSSMLWAVAALFGAMWLLFAYFARQAAEMEARRHEARKAAARREARRRMTEVTASTTANMPAVADEATAAVAEVSAGYRRTNRAAGPLRSSDLADGVVEFDRSRRPQAGPVRHSVADIARRRAASGN